MGEASSSMPSGTGLGGFGGPTSTTLSFDCLMILPAPASNMSGVMSVWSELIFRLWTRNLSLQSLREGGGSL